MTTAATKSPPASRFGLDVLDCPTTIFIHLHDLHHSSSLLTSRLVCVSLNSLSAGICEREIQIRLPVQHEFVMSLLSFPCYIFLAFLCHVLVKKMSQSFATYSWRGKCGRLS